MVEGRIVEGGNWGFDVCMSSIVCCGRGRNVRGVGVCEDEIDRAGGSMWKEGKKQRWRWIDGWMDSLAGAIDTDASNSAGWYSIRLCT
jgi:hypothetical protein